MNQPNRGKVPRAALVGVGGFGHYHAVALSILAQEGLCQFVAGCDSFPEAWKSSPGGPLKDLRQFRTLEEMLSEEELDYIVIASPPHLHDEHALQALDHGAFVYLEKPPVPTFEQLKQLLQHPRSDRIAVGFQMLEVPALRALKRKLCAGELGRCREIMASGLWPRPTSYYERASWAGKMDLFDKPVFDGPLTNALAHIVQNVFFLAGQQEGACAVPETVSGFFARARPIDSYDFAWIKGRTEEGIRFDIMAGHCSNRMIPWKVSVETDKGVFFFEEKDLPKGQEALLESHRSALAAQQGHQKITTPLSDCLGYSMATSIGLISSSGIHSIPQEEIKVIGVGPDLTYHVERVYELVEWRMKQQAALAEETPWLKLGEEIFCQGLGKATPPLQSLPVK